MGRRRYQFRIELEAEPRAAASLRRLIPETLLAAGCVPVSGATIVEAWMVEQMEQLGKEPDKLVSARPELWMHGRVQRGVHH